MKEMSTNQVIKTLISCETEITNKFNNTIIELLRLGYNSERGKDLVSRSIESIRYSLEEIESYLGRSI